jgi:flavin reductase (DIM6/NTAB) family NADH-FMN oxidoreductase RutF
MADSSKPQREPTYSEAPDKFNRRAFRDALGHFPTGVTVITTRDANGDPVGITVNSFNSVSLGPPLVLWSLAQYSPNLPIFQECTHYAINVLSVNQVALSRQFGTTHPDKFAGVSWTEGLGGAPLLADCSAHFECANQFRHYGGDHIIFVGQVERFARFDHPSLVFSRSRYHEVGGMAKDADPE